MKMPIGLPAFLPKTPSPRFIAINKIEMTDMNCELNCDKIQNSTIKVQHF